MEYYENILKAVGNTPLIRLNRVATCLKPHILVKYEPLNPGGSIKDRIGIAMIKDAEEKGLLNPGGTIIEPTSGNTGVESLIESPALMTHSALPHEEREKIGISRSLIRMSVGKISGI